MTPELVAFYDSPLGAIKMTSDGAFLTSLRFDGAATRGAGERETDPVFAPVVKWLDIYFGGADPGFVPPYRLDVTPFARACLGAAGDIPYGLTASYSDIARIVEDRTGRRVSPRAVGGALSHNPVALIVPCHRVVLASGEPGGYAWGIDKKLSLLRMESRA